MFKLYYFFLGNESGVMNIDTFENEQNLNEFIECYGSAIEIFDIR